MRLRVLGCSGGIGGALRTTSFLLDEDTLIDAGTGAGDLAIEALAKIDHVFVTHSHLDHVAAIPFLLDTVGWMRERPITVYAIEPVIEILRQHLFNWKLWPDFTQIPDPRKPFLRYATLQVGQPASLPGGRRITPVPANHVVPAVGFHLDSGAASLVFTGDTTVNDPLWRVVNSIDNLRYLIIETAFRNEDKDLAVASKHLYPILLAEELAKLAREAAVYITHLKPGDAEVTMREIAECAGRFSPRMLENNQVFEF